jgi:uncharacterized membrane-anchored protein
MNTCFLSAFRWRFLKYPTALWLPVFTLFLIQTCWGQEQLTFSSGLLPQEREWISGPATTSLGAIADMQIPVGYRFTGVEGARSLLKQMNNPVPPGLIGILAPNSDDWLAVLEFNEIGYVNDASKDGMNSKVILKAIQDRSEAQNGILNNGGLATTSVGWESQPAYDEKDHSLEWAIQAETQSGKVINHTLVFLGRRGVLDITMIRAYQGSSNLVPLKQLVKNISFKKGQSYLDYQKGDKTAGVSLAKLVVDDENPAASVESKDLPVRTASDNSKWLYYYYYLIGGGVVVFVGLLFFKNLSMRKRHNVVHKHGRHSSVGAAALSKNGAGLNGLELNGSNGHISHRRKISNFGKFYTSMILELSSTACEGHFAHNGNSGTHTLKTPLMLNGSASDPAIVNANLELIANQKHLIDEQRRLLLQQSKLIEEKSQLIEEQSRFLERQSDVIENQFSLKLS